MKNMNNVTLSETDFQKLSALIQHAQPEMAEPLEAELARASIVADGQLPADVVSMNSTVKFQDLETGKESVITLVYPSEANLAENRISILAPIGSALIGLKVGQVIQWPVPNGKEKKLKVISVTGQPALA